MGNLSVESFVRDNWHEIM